ncbi:MAG: hypothetical protein QOG53_2620 [Frankiales bacterium]|jgi:hypothetical protein|nr:hypothetical protein [Frankiales bacterium]
MVAPATNPAWMPFSVRDAVRVGTESGADLSSGAAWADLLASLARAAEVVLSDRVPQNPVDTAAGFRHLLVLMHLAIDEVVRSGGAWLPAIKPANTDNAIKWGMDCPDCAYSGTGIRGDETYLITGNKGSARYVGLQANAGMATTANVLLDEIDTESNGDFTITLSVERPSSGNWLPIASDASTLIIRQFLYDWDVEIPATMRIERVSAPAERSDSRDRVSPDAAIARQLRAVGAFVEANLDFFLAFANPEAPNGFNPPYDGTGMGAAAENRPVIGAWKLAPDEALLIEVTPPVGVYWGLSLGNVWWETIDYAEHITSLNGHQAVIDDDGVFRAVIAHADPGVANWLDTAGHSEGPMILRCVRTETAPVPSTTVLPFDDIASALPAAHPHVTPEERARVIDARRRAVSRRFAR